MKRLILLFLLACPSAHATIAVVQRYDQTTIGTITSTTSGNAFVAVTDSTADATAFAFGGGGGSFTKQFCIPTTAISHLCLFTITNITAGNTAVSCTGCGTVNAWHGREVSGYDATIFLADLAICASGSGVVCNQPNGTLQFFPGFASELVIFAGNCSGSATSMSATGITLTASGFPNGEPGADGISSGTGKITLAPDSGCSTTGNTSLIVGIKGSGAALTCAANISYFDYGTAAGAATNPTVAANLLKTGDIVSVTGWCITTCTATSMKVGTDTAAQLVAGSSDANDGQPFLYADLNSGVSGAQTITFNITGSQTQSQVSYREWIPTASCTASLNVTAGPTNGSANTSITTPSITPSAGDLVLNFTPVQSHTTAVNSPWLCDQYAGSGETLNCFFVTTINAFPYIQNSTGASTANNLTQLNSSTWQGIMASIKLSPPAGGSFPQVFVLRP